MRRLIAVITFVALLFWYYSAVTAVAATLLYSEDFDDGDFDSPSFGSYTVYTRTMSGCSTPPNCEASTPEHYIMSRTGYGGTGYCLSNPTTPADSASKDPYFRLSPSSWAHDGFYTSFRIRIIGDPNTDTYQNLKLVYPHWNGTNAYAMFNTTNVTGATSSLYYSARNNSGAYLEQSTYVTTGNLSDGNWHKVAVWVKFSTSEVWLWVDVETPTESNYTFYRNYTDSAWANPSNLYYFGGTLADEGTYTGQWDYKEMDDIEVWDELPSGEEPNPQPATVGVSFSGVSQPQ